MLSRLADNLYWFGRYLQRAENTARLINVNTILSMDLPRRVALGWEPLIDLVGARAEFAEVYETSGEDDVVRFLSVDERNSGSILSSLHHAREALRTTRDYMPGEVWERVNDLYFYVQDKGERSLGRARRHIFLESVLDGALSIHGLLAFNMSHDVGFHFLGMGANLEQADMTTRILDARSTRAIATEDGGSFEAVEWMSVLRSLTAYEMYRRLVRQRVQGDSVLRFLLQDREFPRSVVFCLMRMQRTLPKLPEKRSVERAITRTLALLRDADVESLMEKGLSEFLDEVQVGIAGINDALSDAYFKV